MITETEWNTKEEKTEHDAFWAFGTEATRQMTQFEYRAELDKIKTDKSFNKLFNR